MEEQQPDKFEGDVRLYKDLEHISPTYEDNIRNKDSAESAFVFFQLALKEYGVDLTKNMKVLEIGSGSAALLDYLRQHGVNAIGVDIRPRGSKDSLQARARIERLPFETEFFDVVLSSQVFDDLVYNANHDQMMSEIARVLKHGGIYAGAVEKIYTKPIEGFVSVPDLSDSGHTIYKKS